MIFFMAAFYPISDMDLPCGSPWLPSHQRAHLCSWKQLSSSSAPGSNSALGEVARSPGPLHGAELAGLRSADRFSAASLGAGHTQCQSLTCLLGTDTSFYLRAIACSPGPGLLTRLLCPQYIFNSWKLVRELHSLGLFPTLFQMTVTTSVESLLFLEVC